MTDVLVIGGGITGRLAAWLFKSHATLRVFDWGAPPSGSRFLTRSFGANYLWEPLEGLECISFPVVTHVDGVVANPESYTAYKRKIGKLADGGDWGLQFNEHSTGWDLVSVPDVPIEYETRVVAVDPHNRRLTTSHGEVVGYDFLVSTIPLYALINILDHDHPLMWELRAETSRKLNSKPIYVKVVHRPPDAPFPPETVYVNYLSNPSVEAYRFCDRGMDRHYEALTSMGLTPTKKLVPGKLIPPYPDSNDIESLLESYGILVSGRYAAWRPDELVHQTFARLLKWKEDLLC